MLIIGVGLVCSFKLDLNKKVCTSYGAVDRASVEFPTTHPYRHGMEGTRYSYLMASDRKNCNLPYRDVVKVWLHTGGYCINVLYLLMGRIMSVSAYNIIY